MMPDFLSIECFRRSRMSATRSLWLFLTTAVLALVQAESSSCVVDLTKENFDQTTRNKNVFIKWYDPNCDHCKQVAPEWEKLAEDWKGHSLVLIAEANCRANLDAERWCFDDMEIYGVPSLMYGEPSHGGRYLQSYGDDKTHAQLTKFVNETLSSRPICSPGNVKNCDKAMQKSLNLWWKLSKEEMEKAIDLKEDEIDRARQQFQWGYDQLRGHYDDAKMVHGKWTAALKRKIKLLHSVQQFKQQRQQQQQQQQ